MATRPWVSDGTTAGTKMLLDVNPSSTPVILTPGLSGPRMPNSSDAAQFTTVGNRTFFTADDGVHGQELWVTDGKAADTYLVRDVNPNNNNGPFTSFAAPDELTAYKGQLYFMADDGQHGYELWTSDGTYNGTHLVKDVNPGPAGSTFPSYTSPFGGATAPQMVVSGGTLYFAADDGSDGNELWASDGTTAGTHLVKDVNPGTTSGPVLAPSGFPLPSPPTPNSSNPSWLTDVNGKLYFTAQTDANGTQVWTSDGTAAGTRLAAGVLPLVNPASLTADNGKLFFTATDSQGVESLWTINPTTNYATRLADNLVVPQANGVLPPIAFFGLRKELLAAGNKVYFAADDGVHGRELFATDGTVQGTGRVKDVRPGQAGAQISLLTALNGKALFVANDGVHGRELWTSDGTAPTRAWCATSTPTPTVPTHTN